MGKTWQSKRLNIRDSWFIIVAAAILAACAAKPIGSQDLSSSEAGSAAAQTPYDPHFTNKNGSTHLMAAAYWGDVPLMSDLLSRGADINQLDNDKQTALHQAVIVGRPESVAFLLERKAAINLVDGAGFTALMYAASKSSLMIVDFLVAAQADASVKDARGWSALMFAVSRGDPKIVERILRYDGRAKDDAATDGARPLILAVEDRNLPVARLLVDAGADPAAGGPGDSALALAAKNKQPEMTRLLCSHLPAHAKAKAPPRICLPR